MNEQPVPVRPSRRAVNLAFLATDGDEAAAAIAEMALDAVEQRDAVVELNRSALALLYERSRELDQVRQRVRQLRFEIRRLLNTPDVTGNIAAAAHAESPVQAGASRV